MIEFIYDHIRYFRPFELEKSPNYKIVALNQFKQGKNVVAVFYNIFYKQYLSRDLRLIHEDFIKEIYNNIKSNLSNENLWND
jgi:hypothetical protein